MDTKLKNRLSSFISGPLDDKHGGSALARDGAIKAAKNSSGGIENEDASEIKNVQTAYRVVFDQEQPVFSYQQEIIELVTSSMKSRGGKGIAMVSLPTGAGKTRTAMWFFRNMAILGECKRLLWIAPSIILVDQAFETMQDLWIRYQCVPRTEVCVGKIDFGRSNRSEERFAVLMTAQMATRRLDEIRRYDPDLLIFDEAHQAGAQTFSRIVTEATKLTNCTIVGLTATPGRSDEDESGDLSRLFGGNLITPKELGRDPVRELQRRRVYCRLLWHEISLPPQWNNIRVRSQVGNNLSVDELALNPARFWATVSCVRALPEDNRCLIFCASIAHCCAIAGALWASNIPNAVISYETPLTLRSQILAKFASGEIRVLLNKELLATGYDCPALTDLILASPIRSPILWEQIVGRASRGEAVGGTAEANIWELDDHCAMHSQVMSYARFRGESWD